jgi:hypothetical protein
MRDLNNVELQAINGGASGLAMSVGLAAVCIVSLVAVSMMRRSNAEVIVLNTDKSGDTTAPATTAPATTD